MPSLKELYEKAQSTGKVEYSYFTGGSTSQPFNQTSIGFGDNDQPYIRLGYDPAVKFRSDDPTNIFNSALAATRDTLRITRFLSDFPNGPLWLTKQTGLQLSNPDTSYKSVNKTSTVNDILNGPRFYNPLGINTIAQVPAGVLGLHFTRHGLSPLNDVGYVSQNTTNTENGKEFQSRLKLYQSKLLYKDPSQEIELNNYDGGPNSFYGIGKTRTISYVNQQTKNWKSANNGNGFDGTGAFVPFTYENISLYSQDVRNGVVPTQTNRPAEEKVSLPGNGYIQDFRQINDTKRADKGYPLLNVHNRIGVTTGQVAVGTPNTVDSINTINITPRAIFYNNSDPATNPNTSVNSNLFYGGLYDSAAEVQSKTNGNFGRDIIKFRIELLNNDVPVLDGAINTDVLAFRAYLDALSDDMSPQWKSFNYMGRGEDFYVYEKFSRKISFSFILFAHSKYEMPAIYTKLNYLMSAMAPDYNRQNQMRGTYAYLTIGDYIYQQPGVFTGMNISNLLDAPWEIALSEPESRNAGDGTDKKQHEVPKYMKVTMNFNPIHNFLPRKNHRTTPHTATFITPNFREEHPNYYLPQGTENRPGLINIPEKNITVP